MNKNSNLIFVDCEANGQCPVTGELTEFGAVHYSSMETFYGDLRGEKESDEIYAVFENFKVWIKLVVPKGRPVFVSDNPAFDWQWINYYFYLTLGENPFGWSARRISDYYAGLRGDFWQSQAWKQLRVTPHDHNPVHDALGNVEAFKNLEQRRIDGEFNRELTDTLKDQSDEIANLKQQLAQKQKWCDGIGEHGDILLVPRMEGTDNVDNS